jgi:predicted enzyme related to lactoylglutathione lyase
LPGTSKTLRRNCPVRCARASTPLSAHRHRPSAGCHAVQPGLRGPIAPSGYPPWLGVPVWSGTRVGGIPYDPGYTVPDMDWKIELVAIPVTDVDRAKAFYVEQVGFHADHDYEVSDVLRFVQLTPPGSACSIVLGTGVTQMPPGSQKGVQCVVADVEAARRELIAHGVQTSDIDVQPWGSFVTFSDPDGNTWALQQVS